MIISNKLPKTTDVYKRQIVLYEPVYPNILFAQDGEIYEFAGKKAIVIGGAYSIDKYYRLSGGGPWFESEQPDEWIKAYVEAQLKKVKWEIDYVFSHTVPLSYEPREAFLPNIDEGTVDKSTEKWLETIAVSYTHLDVYKRQEAPDMVITDDDDAAIYFSSGTTGFPKAILHAHSSLMQAAEVEMNHHRQTREDNFLCMPPLYHTGAKMHWFGSLLSGSKAVLLRGVKPEWILSLIHI